MTKQVRQLPSFNSISYSMDEIVSMFSLSEKELKMRILHYNAGLSSFAATLHFRQGFVVALDPFYGLTPEQMKAEVNTAQQNLRQEIAQHPERFAIKHNIKIWLDAHEARYHLFLDNYNQQNENKLYVAARLPHLPFETEAFDLALVSHHLFTQNLTIDEMMLHMLELTRVANDVRIFPLVDQQAALSEKVGMLVSLMQQQSMGVEIKASHFELQKYGNALMRVFNPYCTVATHQRHQGEM